ncbi:MAG: dTDP-glucose pyrophosphorylase [Gammaproteobacteria bacterium]|nr:dTDP-glucose pyrophosphorylase [Gammaproteobacteria bacterium]
MTEPQDDVIGLIPAGGQATRLGRLPCSKELYPIGFQTDPARTPKVVSHYLLERLRVAGVRRVFIILRAGKWDIPAYFGEGAWLSMDLAYLLMGAPFGTPYTLDQAWPFVRHARVALGFPDILFEPVDVYASLLARQTRTGATVVLGLFPASRPRKCDLVDIDEHGRVRRIVVKPFATELRFTWMTAVWTPVFSEFMHHHLAARLSRQSTPSRELFIGDVIQAAIDDGLSVEAECFATGRALDIGTPDELGEAIAAYT